MKLKLKWVCSECGSDRMLIEINLKERTQSEECRDCGALVIIEDSIDREPIHPSKSGGDE